VGAVVVWLVSTIGAAVDRGLRTETIEGFGAAGPIHLAADGRIILARASSSAATPDGRIEAFDPTTHARTTILDGLVHPVAADVSLDGTVCAIVRPADGEEPTGIRCSSGLTVDVNAGSPAGLPGARAAVADIVSDGADGWVVVDPARVALLHVNRAGTVDLLARIRQYPSVPALPLGLTRDGSRILVAAGDPGFALASTADRGIEIKTDSIISGSFVLALAARPNGNPLVAVVNRGEGSVGFVAIPSSNGEIGPTHLTDDLEDLHGFVILQDGRVAVATASRLVIVRPNPPLQ
ncbi:MAG TPA: hypothetical protein VFY18_06735, partial [Candidatus Limnocylindrales bacterium]|nr:hypothetical protein [Candidatus Limnocylindrales bacterium]